MGQLDNICAKLNICIKQLILRLILSDLMASGNPSNLSINALKGIV
jgi:hypothetical protein